ncbi:MAG: carbohydrate kinase [Balneolaceae bacterium]|nr:carbohydrate kinase [Balneolaceae bacterium]
MSNHERILCIGEILWDSLPSGLYLGGAPLNVSYHLNQFGIESTIASRVGDDRLGREAIRRIKRMQMATDQIQCDGEHETGFVGVELSADGDPEYDIIQPVAWDFIEPTASLRTLATQCWGVVFGSLAQRNAVSRNTIRTLWEMDIRKILDMNLRRPYVDREIVYESLSVSDIVKMNEEELNQLKEWYNLSGGARRSAEQVADRFGCSVVCVTRGANGAEIFRDGQWHEHKGFPTKVKDAVGAGDAFLAALLYGIYSDSETEELLTLANATGAFVAQKDGATPAYRMRDILDEIEER